MNNKGKMESEKSRLNIKSFNGEKYSVWKFRVRALLSEFDVLKVIDENPPRLMSDDWKRAEQKAKSVIIEYLSDSFLFFAQPTRTAKECFAALDEIYERQS